VTVSSETPLPHRIQLPVQRDAPSSRRMPRESPSVANISTLRRQAPPAWPPDPRRNLPHSDTGRPRSRCHSAHKRPPRESSEPARVRSMLGETHRRCQLAGGPADSARMPPRGGGTTASAVPPNGSGQDAAAPDSGGPGPGFCPEWQRARCARIFRWRDRAAWRSGVGGPHNGDRPARRCRTPGA
jgi:hypothetical protein